MTSRTICIILVILILVGAAAAGVVMYPTLNAQPVAVYSVSMISYTGDTGSTAESYGVVTADKVQAIYVSETQKVTRIHVYDGQEVKKGDLLYTYDTTLTDLELDRKDLSIQQMEINLKTAREDLKRLNAMKPMVIHMPEEGEEEEENLGAELTTAYQISSQPEFDGSSKEKALICWINSAATLDDALLETLRQKANEFQTINAEEEEQESSSASPAVQASSWRLRAAASLPPRTSTYSAPCVLAIS